MTHTQQNMYIYTYMFIVLYYLNPATVQTNHNTPSPSPPTQRFGALLCSLSTGTALLLACIDQSHRTDAAAAAAATAPYQEEEAETARRLQQQGGEYYKPRNAADAGGGSAHHHREWLGFGWFVFYLCGEGGRGGGGLEGRTGGEHTHAQRERERPMNIYV